MRIIAPAEDMPGAKLAARKVPIKDDPPPYSPPTPTGLTDKQQAALFYSRKHRRQRLGVVPQPPLP